MDMGEVDYTGYVTRPEADNMMEMTFIYAELRFSYGLADNRPFTEWKECFEGWAGEFEESYAGVDWDEVNYDEEILKFTLGKIDGRLEDMGYGEKASELYPEPVTASDMELD